MLPIKNMATTARSSLLSTLMIVLISCLCVLAPTIFFPFLHKVDDYTRGTVDRTCWFYITEKKRKKKKKKK
jgi:hypothetical protein